MKHLRLWFLALLLVGVSMGVGAVVIQDPSTFRGMNVTSDGHGEVVAITQSGFEHASEEEGLSFVWSSTYSATGGEEIISVRNDDNDRRLHITRIQVGTDTSSLFTLIEVTSGTPAGTPITAQNLNLDSGKVAEETAFGNASVTGTVAGNTIGLVFVATGDSQIFPMDSALILAKEDAISITLTTSGVASVTIYGFYDE